MPLTISVIVCAHNEAQYLPACLYSVLGQTRPPDEVLVIDNASEDSTREIAARVPGVRVVPEPCRAPLTWLEAIERRFERDQHLLPVGSTSTRGRRCCAATRAATT